MKVLSIMMFCSLHCFKIVRAFYPVIKTTHSTIFYRSIRTKRPALLSTIFAKIGGFGMKEETDPGEVKGTTLKILKYPHPLLRTENEVVTVFDENLKNIAREMLLVMYAADGIGLAAPQVGINKRIMVFNEFGDSSKLEKEVVLINPIILNKSDETDVKEEGCLSFPLINGDVVRSIWIQVEYLNLLGEKKTVIFKDFQARIFQHEYDHLDKVLFIDRLVEVDKKMNQKRLDKYVKKYGPGAAP